MPAKVGASSGTSDIAPNSMSLEGRSGAAPLPSHFGVHSLWKSGKLYVPAR